MKFEKETRGLRQAQPARMDKYVAFGTRRGPESLRLSRPLAVLAVFSTNFLSHPWQCDL
jgi:hypothetical protein